MKQQGYVYLDANFLIPFFADKHTDKDSSRKLFFEFFKSNAILFISTLALDETWYKIWEIPHREKRLKKKKWPSIREFYPKIKLIMQEIRKLPETFRLVQFENDLGRGINNAVENVGNYGLEPRDAFHLAIMQDLNVTKIATKDKEDFQKVPEIQIISF